MYISIVGTSYCNYFIMLLLLYIVVLFSTRIVHNNNSRDVYITPQPCGGSYIYILLLKRQTALMYDMLRYVSNVKASGGKRHTYQI